MTTLEVLIGLSLMVLSAFGSVILLNFKDLKSSVKEMSASVVQLNIKLEKVITDQVWHKEEITEIKERMDAIEKKVCEKTDR